MKSNIIGLTGNAGVGKDTFATEFHYYGFRQYSFADPVKKAAAVAFGIALDYFRVRELKEETHPYWNLSPRQMAQLVGTEMFRSIICDDFWIKRLEFALIQDFDSLQTTQAIITDVRFQNEADWIVNKMGGTLIKITRPGYEGNVGIPGHASEAGIDTSKFIKGVNYYEEVNSGDIYDWITKSKTFCKNLLS